MGINIFFLTYIEEMHKTNVQLYESVVHFLFFFFLLCSSLDVCMYHKTLFLFGGLLLVPQPGKAQSPNHWTTREFPHNTLYHSLVDVQFGANKNKATKNILTRAF